MRKAGAQSDVTEEVVGLPEETVRSLFESNPQPMWIYDLETLRFLAVNDAAIYSYGYSRDELLGMTIKDIRPTEDIPALLESIARVTEGLDVAGVWRHRKKDGSVIQVEITSHTLVFEGRRTELVMAKDVTDRVRYEQALKESEARYREIFDAAGDGICVVGMDGHILDANPAHCQMLGYSREELVDKAVFDIVAPEDWPCVREQVDQITQGRRVRFECTEVAKDGTSVLVEMHGMPHTYNGRSALLGIIRDISEQKHAKIVVESREHLLRQLIENTPAAVAMSDMDMRYIIASKRWKVDYHLGDQDIIGRSHYDVFPDIPERWKRIHQRCLAGAVEKNDEDRFERADGGVEWIKWEIQPWRDDAGAIGGIIMFTEVITERRCEQETLRESEEKYRSVVERANDGIIVIQDTLLKFVNQRFAEMGGFAVDELVGRPFTDFTPEEVLPTLLERYKKRMAGDEVPLVYETVLERKDKSKIHVEINAGLTMYEGRPADLVMVRDITERKLAALALQEVQDRLQGIVDNTTTVIYLKDAEGRLILLNNQYEKVVGIGRDEMLGKTEEAFMPPDIAELMRENDRKVMEAGAPMTFEEQAPLEGRLKTFLSVKFPLRDSSGAIYGVGGISTDMTDRKAAEDALAKSEAMYRELVEDISDWVWEVDRVGRYTYSSPVVEKILGYKPEEMIGHPALDFIIPEDRESSREAFETAIREGTDLFSLPNRNRHKDGSIRYLETSGSPVFDDKGKVIGMRGIDRDVTERRLAEEEKRRFYRTAIYSLTDGKLDIVSAEEAKAAAEPAEATVTATNPREASAARSVVRDALRRKGLEGERLNSFIIAVGEAINNAVKHAGRGVVSAGARNGLVWVSVCDDGPGIEHMTLPRVALEKGFSTKPSLGLGYSIILDAADHVELSTGPDGTQVVMEKAVTAPRPMAPLLDRLPDTW